MTRHPYVPTISFGNWLTIGVIALGGVGTWGTMVAFDARAEERIINTERRVAVVEQASKEQIAEIKTDIAALKKQAHAMEVNQAVLMTNVEMLVRAQGLRPVEAR